jgi:uncharacterized protein (DUF2141 family)
MHWLTRAALAAALLLTLAPAARATELLVRVLNVADARGTMRVQVCLPDEWLKDGCRIAVTVPARAGVMTVAIPDVMPGRYAILAHHDSDGDADVNQNFLGVPTEGIGFSHGPSVLLGAPSWQECALTVEGARTVVDITLKFE